MYYLTRISITLLLGFILLPVNASAIEASTSADIPPQQNKVVRLKNLPAAASLQVEIKSNGKLTTALYHESEIKKKAGKAKSAFNSTFKRRIAFSIKIEKAGNYYLILNNKSAQRTITANIAFNAENDPAIKKAKMTLLKFEYALFKYIDFKKFPIKISACKSSTLSINDRKSALCKEHITLAAKLLNSRSDISDYLFYSLLHLGGHQILPQWGIESPDENTVNEFAVGMLFLLNKQEKTRAVFDTLAGKYQSRNISDSDAAFKKYHIPDVEQLNKLTKLIENKSLSPDWERIIIPRIRTKVLEKLEKQSVDWIDTASIRKELAIRKVRTMSEQDDISF